MQTVFHFDSVFSNRSLGKTRLPMHRLDMTYVLYPLHRLLCLSWPSTVFVEYI